MLTSKKMDGFQKALFITLVALLTLCGRPTPLTAGDYPATTNALLVTYLGLA